MCGKWISGTDIPLTLSYSSRELSTLELRSDGPPATKVLDYADLPCPPSEVADAYDSSIPYFPILITGLAHQRVEGYGSQLAKSSCLVSAVRDPPVHAFHVEEISEAKDGGDSIPG